MSTWGKVCLVLTLLLLLVTVAPIPSPWGGWAPTLLVIHNEWSLKLRDAKEKNLKDVTAFHDAEMELRDAAAELARLQMGWDRVWEFRNGEGNRSITIRPDRILAVSGIGHQIGYSEQQPNNFVTRQITDENGNQQLVPPVVHVFRAVAPETFVYVGEYIADPNNLNQQSAFLVPTKAPVPEQPAPAWQQGNGIWRLRTIIPAGPRSDLDNLNVRMIRSREMLRETNANLVQQEALLAAAQAQLETRKGELLGDPNATPVATRPEFSEGLLSTIENEEEARNQIQVEVDALRRAIKQAADERLARQQELQQLIQQLPSSTKSTQLTDRRPIEVPQ